MSLDLDLTFPIRDVPSADLMRLKATCLWNAGIIDDGERELVQQRAERFLQRNLAVPHLGHQPCTPSLAASVRFTPGTENPPTGEPVLGGRPARSATGFYFFA
jgi:hypothetical protein